MKSLIFFGSDQYSAIVLSTLLSSPLQPPTYHLTTIVTDRPKPVGREQKVEPNPVEKLAITHNLKVSYYPDFDHSLITENTLGLCASFDHLVPATVIDLFHGQLFNLHPSLLPQYRNVSPVQYALALGDTETGITLFRITTGIDNGEIIAQVAEPIHPDDTTPTLTSRLFPLGAELFLRFLGSDLVGCKPNQKPTRSDLEGVPLIFTHRLTRDSGYLEWPVVQKLLAGQPVSPNETENELLKLRLTKIQSSGLGFSAWNLVLSDLIRSLTPWPGVWTLAKTKKGDLRLSLIITRSHTRYAIPDVLIAGKPKPIAWSDFTKYYL